MSQDIQDILKNWAYRPGEVTARRIRGDDGRDKIQLRLDLGVLQMETSGRPDGQRPHGQESLLDYYENQLARHRQQHGSAEGFELDEQACELLRAEGVMYYHRYLAEFVLEDYEAVDRDSLRNLRLFDFCKAYAQDESDRYMMEQYRPYVIMMATRARALISLRTNRRKAALAALKKGMEEIEAFYRSYGQDKQATGSGELAALRVMIREIESSVPLDPLRKLRQDLAKAVEEERYEDAASLRDRLRQVKQDEGDGPQTG